MALKLQAQQTGKLELSAVGEQLVAAESLRRQQASASPPIDAPWCFFDLAEIRLYNGDKDAFLDHLERGVNASTQRWEIETFCSALKTALVDTKIDLPGLSEGMARLQRALGVFVTPTP